jgi:hypothetical protein
MARSNKMRVTAFLAGLALCVPAALLAQQPQRDPRVNPPVMPAGESTSRAPETAMAAGAAAPAATSQPDQRPLTGAELLSLGTFDSGHSYLLPSLSFTTGSEWNDGGYRFTGNVRGGIAFHRDTGYNQMSLTYSTGAVFGGHEGAFRTQAHSLVYSQTFQFRRWTLMVTDAFNFLPESSFGFGQFHGIGQPNAGGLPNWNPGFSGGSQVGIDPTFIPDQTIHTGDSTRWSNTIIGQGTMQITPRWSMTTTGSFGVLRFLDGGFVESNNGSIRSGLNYMLNARDTLGFNYSANLIRFSNDGAINNHVVQVMYGRRLTGRLALRVGAGPSFVHSDNPVTGSNQRASWSASSHLTYSVGQSTYGFGYIYHTTSGSGVQVGAQTHSLQFMGGRQISRMWSLAGAAGYAHNTGIAALNTGNLRRTFNTWYASVDFGRPLTRYSRLGFRYHVTRQSVGCPPTALTCVGSGLRHQVGINIDFTRQFNPIELN